jgi:hypothetical protein
MIDVSEEEVKQFKTRAEKVWWDVRAAEGA